MKIISFVSQKGGAGKTTLCLNLAIAARLGGLNTIVLDLDPQASSAQWADAREDGLVTSLQASRLSRALDIARSSEVELILIDSAPHAVDVTMSLCEVSDLVLVPCRAGILDVRVIGVTARLAKAASRPSYVILNCVPPRADRVAADAAEAAGSHDIEVCPVVIHQRAAFGHSLTASQTVPEFAPTSLAAEEIRNLFLWSRALLAI